MGKWDRVEIEFCSSLTWTHSLKKYVKTKLNRVGQVNLVWISTRYTVCSSVHFPFIPHLNCNCSHNSRVLCHLQTRNKIELRSDHINCHFGTDNMQLLEEKIHSSNSIHTENWNHYHKKIRPLEICELAHGVVFQNKWLCSSIEQSKRK